jgi:hypothetical protein
VGKSLRERWARLSSMSGDELLDRVRQQVNARADAWRYRLGSDFRVQLRQADSEAGKPQFFFATHEVPGVCRLLKERLPQQAVEIVQRAERICGHQFDLLGYKGLDYGEEIDWHLDRVHGKRAPRRPFYQIRYLDFAEVGDVKVTWELNRHQHFVTLARAYRLTGHEKFAVEVFDQWKHWHRENPYPIGVNWASSLEVAFRTLSWLWMRFLLQDCPVEPSAFREEWMQALALSGRHIERYLSTYFSPNTHLLGEAIALFFIGTLCPELPAAARWKQRGGDIVMQEAQRQVRADGLHFEQSTYYHVYALDLFLHARILAARNGIPVPAEFDVKLEKMVTALALLSRAGAPPAFGDDDGGRVFDASRNQSRHMLDPLATGAVLFQRGDFKFLAGEIREETLWLMGEAGIARFDALSSSQPSAASAALPESGCYLMASGEQQFVIDAGPQGATTAGHGHADALSVSITSPHGPLLLDPGTCEYVGERNERDRFRGTSAHNTLQVDGQDQADPKGPFAWTNLVAVAAERWITGENFDLFVGSHTGYQRLPSPVLHRRWVFSRKGSFWLVRDRAEGEGQHRLDLHWHLAPDLVPQNDIADAGSDAASRVSTFVAADGSRGLALVTADGDGWARKLVRGYWSPAYGQKQPALVLHFGTMASLPVEFVTLLVPVSSGKCDTGSLPRINGESVCGYRYREQKEDHNFFFALGRGNWTLGNWSSDAEFLYWSQREGLRCLAVCGGTYADFGGERVVSTAKKNGYCEIVDAEGVSVLSPDKSAVVVHRPLSTLPLESEPALVTANPPLDEL